MVRQKYYIFPIYTKKSFLHMYTQQETILIYRLLASDIFFYWRAACMLIS